MSKPDPGQSASPSRQCPECGCDRWKMRDAERVYNRNFQLQRDVDKLAAENGVLSYHLKAVAEAHKDNMSRAHRKISRQARVIKRLEAKLRALKVKPYQGAPMGETAPAAEYDAEHGDA